MKQGIFLGLILCSVGRLGAQADKSLDTLEFVDGERLIGHLVSAAGSSLRFHSEAAGDITVDWAKVKSLRTAGKFAVAKKGERLEKQAVAAAVPQGAIAVSEQKITVEAGGSGGPTVIPVSEAANVIAEASFLKARQTPKLLEDWHGSAAFGLDLISATQTSRNISSALSLQRAVPGEAWTSPRYKTILDFNLAEGKVAQPGTPTIHTDLIHTAIDHEIFLSRKLFGFGSGEFLHSLSQGIRLQQTYGGGVGLVVLRSEHGELDVKGSVDYIRQELENGVVAGGASVPTPERSLIGATGGENYTHRLPGGIALKQGLTVIPTFNETRAYTFNAFLNLLIPVHKRISITLGGVEGYVNAPPAGFKKNSFELVTQLAYKIN